MSQGPNTPTGLVVAVCTSPGGIPKKPVERAHVTFDGLAGDGHRHRLHGGRDRAVCILSTDEVDSLTRDGVAGLVPGSFGENLLVRGLDFAALRPGDRLAVGDAVVIEIHEVREPCGTLRPLDRRFPDLMVGRSGFVCRVVREGDVAPGQAVSLVR